MRTISGKRKGISYFYTERRPKSVILNHKFQTISYVNKKPCQNHLQEISKFPINYNKHSRQKWTPLNSIFQNHALNNFYSYKSSGNFNGNSKAQYKLKQINFDELFTNKHFSNCKANKINIAEVAKILNRKYILSEYKNFNINFIKSVWNNYKEEEDSSRKKTVKNVHLNKNYFIGFNNYKYWLERQNKHKNFNRKKNTITKYSACENYPLNNSRSFHIQNGDLNKCLRIISHKTNLEDKPYEIETLPDSNKSFKIDKQKGIERIRKHISNNSIVCIIPFPKNN